MADTRGSENDLKVVIDTQGEDKTITYDGVVHPVRVQSVDGDTGVIVFVDASDRKTLISFYKRFENSKYSLDFRVNDMPIGNLVYLRPV